MVLVGTQPRQLRYTDKTKTCTAPVTQIAQAKP